MLVRRGPKCTIQAKRDACPSPSESARNCDFVSKTVRTSWIQKFTPAQFVAEVKLNCEYSFLATDELVRCPRQMNRLKEKNSANFDDREDKGSRIKFPDLLGLISDSTTDPKLMHESCNLFHARPHFTNRGALLFKDRSISQEDLYYESGFIRDNSCHMCRYD
jgi:hypothetical protein